ncbi:uncharacterized protein LOC127660234 isoform X1 [Xyrauchen texanus]|uniref:uncharacterized protein LOC127660234 isoform X1 n=1 Tax=Xyrauchen texanus TaxID=154827 RepID=UPI002241C6C3|nr:uncharacterized protein LOC127660234 isoform X1 [Xyrauchen texanus]
MPLISLDDDDQRWVPTHVNVTVVRARGLRTKGKQGSRYVYTIIQVGKEKYTTGLVEKAEEPQWNEECSFELLPGLLEAGGMSAYPPGSSNLVLTVMHRVLIGLDVFLGQTIVPLDKVFQDGMCPRNEWLRLHSKAGRKEKERGELQVTVQFTRNNMTASMYDLTVNDKPRSAFGKLKDRVTGRKRGDMESSSAILPGRFAALSGSVGPPFVGDGGLNEPGVEEGVDEQRSKVKDFFLKGRLRKNSDTRSCSSLASESSMASSSGDPFIPIELSRTPIYSSRPMEPFRMDSEGGIKVFTDPKVMTHKRAHSDEASKITSVSRPSTTVETLKGQSTAFSKSTLCINGSHIYSSEPVSPKSPGNLPAKRSLLEKCAPLSRSLQNLTRRGEDSQKSDGRCWSIEKSKKEDGDADRAISQTQGAAMSEGKPVQATGPQAASPGVMEVVDKGKKFRKTLFSSGRSDSLPAKPEQNQVSAALEGRRRGWFVSGDSQNKPRLGVSPKLESSSGTPSPHFPCLPSQPPSSLPLDCTTTSVSPSSGNQTNPFTHPSPTPPSISPSNPFFTRLQQNPFFEDLIAEETLKSPTAGYNYPAISVGPGLPSHLHNGLQNRMSAIKRERPRSMARQRSLPSIMPETPGTNNSNTHPSHSLCERAGEWDDFEAFASSRLKSPMGTPTRPPSAPFLSQVTNTNQMVNEDYKPSNSLRVDEVDMAFPKPWDLPPLPPRRSTRTRVPARERCSDSWLDRAQELAVQKEACFLSQTDFASLQHVREDDMKRNSLILCSDKEPFKDLHRMTSVGYNKMCPSLETELHCGLDEKKTERGCPNLTGPTFETNNISNSSMNGFGEETLGSSLQSEFEYTVPETLCFSSDWETTVTESLCSSPQTQPKHDLNSSCEIDPKQKASTKRQHKTNTSNGIGLFTLSPRDSNNNTDSLEFAFIDSGSSPSEMQPPFEIIKDSVKALKVHQSNFSDVDSGNGMTLSKFSPELPEDLICRMASELEMFSPKKSCVSYTLKDITYNDSDSSNQSHLDCSLLFETSYEGQGEQEVNPCEDTEHCNTTLKSHCESLNKEISVITQTLSHGDTVTNQIKPEAAKGNVVLQATHDGGDIMSCKQTLKECKVHSAESEDVNLISEVLFSKTSEIEESSLTQDEQISFKGLHARVAPRSSRTPCKTDVTSARIRPRSTKSSPKTVLSTESLPSSPNPQSSSTSYLILRDLSPSPTSLAGKNACLHPDTSLPVIFLKESPSMGSTSSTAQPQVDASLPLSPEEIQPSNILLPLEESSPHPVKPLTNTTMQAEKKLESRSVLEKLKSTINPGRSVPPTTTEDEKTQLAQMEARAQYQNMTNLELIALLLQQETDVKKQRAETEVQEALLEKREAELKKMKIQVRDLEDYIDKLLVRIMEQTPTLLQVRARPK